MNAEKSKVKGIALFLNKHPTKRMLIKQLLEENQSQSSEILIALHSIERKIGIIQSAPLFIAQDLTESQFDLLVKEAYSKEAADYAIENNDMWQLAYMISKNAFNTNFYDREIFKKHFNAIIKYIKVTKDIDRKRFYFSEAQEAYSLFGENTILDEESLQTLIAANKTLIDNANEIDDFESNIFEGKVATLKSKNEENLDEIGKLINKIPYIKTDDEVNKMTSEMESRDSLLAKDFFNEKQKKTYEDYTKKFMDSISEAMVRVEIASSRDYNIKAVQDFKALLDKVKEDKSLFVKAKTEKELLDAGVQALFKYDATRLFNETMIYYNYVYSFILEKLDDNGKVLMTQLSINTEKIKGDDAK